MNTVSPSYPGPRSSPYRCLSGWTTLVRREVAGGRVSFAAHALARMRQRGVAHREVLAALRHGRAVKRWMSPPRASVRAGDVLVVVGMHGGRLAVVTVVRVHGETAREER